MNALVFLLIALVLSGIGSAVLVLRNRRPTSVESGIDEFRREMRALAPPDPRRPMRHDDPDLGRGGSVAGPERTQGGEPEAGPSVHDPIAGDDAPTTAEPFASPSEPFASPDEPFASPAEPFASPSEPRRARPDEPEVL